jgi:hypothetical protein
MMLPRFSAMRLPYLRWREAIRHYAMGALGVNERLAGLRPRFQSWLRPYRFQFVLCREQFQPMHDQVIRPFAAQE